MPLRPSPKSLKQSSLDSVANHLELICYGFAKGTKGLSQLIDSDGIKKFKSPFHDWPGSLLEDLSNTIYSRRAGLAHLLYPVIQPQMRHYDIQIHGSIYVAMDLVSKRCKDLISLNFAFSVNLPPMYYTEFFKHFRHLTKLNLYGSMVDDIAFGSIGNNCFNLLELNAAKTWITNYGLKKLSCSEDGTTVLCPKLRHLIVTETRITTEGLSEFLLTHPDMIKLEHEESLHLVGRFWMKSTPSKLVQLCSTAQRVSPSEFEHAMTACPNLTTLSITSAGLGNEQIYFLMNMKYLTSLHLGNLMADSFNFREGVAPVLQCCGPTLKKLILEKFTEIDVGLIGNFCPQLAHLALSSITSYTPVLNLNESYFQKLRNIEFWSNLDAHICPSVIKQCLMNSAIERALFQCVGSITDIFFFEVLDLNPQLKLENLVFDRCHGISPRLLWRFLQLPNQLSILRCWNCRGITSLDKDEIKSVVREENLCLYWEWYPYIEEDHVIPHDRQEYE